VGAFHGNLPHVANIDNQHNSTNLQVSVATTEQLKGDTTTATRETLKTIQDS
jgi:hypothetical protein